MKSFVGEVSAMSRSLSHRDSSMPVDSLDGVRTKQLRYGEGGQPSSIRLTTVVKDALHAHYGSLKAAAISLRMDEGQLSRELKSGDFKLEKLERADTEAQAYVAKALHQACGDCDPKARRQQLIRDLRARLDELAEVG
jgi:hypothetical protein